MGEGLAKLLAKADRSYEDLKDFEKIQFVPIIFALGHWARMHSRATDWLNTPIAPFYQGDDQNMAIFLQGLRQIHLEGTPLNEVHPIFGQLAS